MRCFYGGIIGFVGGIVPPAGQCARQEGDLGKYKTLSYQMNLSHVPM